MKKLILIFLLTSHYCFSQKNIYPINTGESCSYQIYYGFINAGHAIYSVTKKNEEISVIVQGRSNSVVDLFFKIRDRYESKINTKSLFTL